MVLRMIPALAIAVWIGLAGTPLTTHAPSPSRTTVIISDLHLGNGKDPGGHWNPLEDFRWRDDFAPFLRMVDQTGKGATDLILNGDTFELLQSASAKASADSAKPSQGESATADCRHAEPRLGCTEAEALARLERVLAAHALEISDLGTFARAGSNHLVLVPGDHDAALVFPSLTKRVVAALNAPGRVDVASRGYWLSSDGSVYVEHGHQIKPDSYRFASWPQPFIRQGGRTYLERTWGEQLVQGLYDQYEARYPILDNVAEDGIGLKYAVTADSAVLPSAATGSLLKFLLSKMTWQQFRLDIDGGDVEPPEWDVPAVRRSGAAFFVESLLPDDRFRARADAALKDNRLGLDVGVLTDPEIVAICDYRAAMRRARRRLERTLTQVPHVGAAIAECPRTPETRGSRFEYFWRSRDARIVGRLEEVRAALTRDRRSSDVKVFVSGHTHLGDGGFVPVRGAASPIVLNTGAWQRTISPFQVEQTMTDRNWSEAELLRQLQPEQLPACYGVVWIDSYPSRPRPRFRYWRQDGRWGAVARDAPGIANACSAGPGAAP